MTDLYHVLFFIQQILEIGLSPDKELDFHQYCKYAFCKLKNYMAILSFGIFYLFFVLLILSSYYLL